MKLKIKKQKAVEPLAPLDTEVVSKLCRLLPKLMLEGNVSVEFPFEANGKVQIIVGSNRKKYVLGNGATLTEAIADAEATQKLISEKGFFMRKPVVK